MLNRFRCFLTICFALIASNAEAQSGVEVVFHGGIDSLQIWVPDQAGGSTLQGERVFSDELTIASDVRVLPDGGALVGQASGEGAVIYGPERDVRFVLDPAARYRQVDSVAVTAYLAGGEPARIAIADSFGSVVTVRDLGTDQVVWFQNMALVAGFAQIPDVIALPNNQIVIAANYEPVGIRTLDLFDFGNGIVDRRQYANFEHVEAPPETTVVEALSPSLRSVFAGPAGDELIVGTQYTVFSMALDGTVNWEVDVSAMPSIGGEVADAKILPSGLVAFATFEPGLWTQTSANHRIHWYDPVQDAIVASTAPLLRAPVGLEVAEGHGGTGTLGYVAGFDELPGSIDDLMVTSFQLGGSEFELGSIVSTEAVIFNLGTMTVEVASLVVSSAPGTCAEPTGEPVTFAEEADGFGLFPSSSFRLTGEIAIAQAFELGPWCARLLVTDVLGVQHEMAEPLEFSIIKSGEGSSSNVVIEDLRFEDLSDTDLDMGIPDMGQEAPPEDEGCACNSVQTSPPWPVAFLLLLGLMWRRRQ